MSDDLEELMEAINEASFAVMEAGEAAAKLDNAWIQKYLAESQQALHNAREAAES